MSLSSKNKNKYIFINIKNNIDNKEKIISFFNDLLGIDYFDQCDDTYIYKLLKDDNYELEDIIDSLNVDFGVDINVFETNFLSSEADMRIILEVYLKNIKVSYSNVSKLVLDLVNNSLDDLHKIKKIILKNIDNDNDLKNIIIAMYKNNLNVSQTANAVYMHRNTVINKLELIKKNSGLDIQKFYDAMAMYILIYIK